MLRYFDAESLSRIFMRGDLSRFTKSFQIQLVSLIPYTIHNIQIKIQGFSILN